MLTYQTLNPRTGVRVATFAFTTATRVAESLTAAKASAEAWATSSPSEREELLRKLALAFRDARDELVALSTLEVGRRLDEARSEVEKCALLCEYYADNLGDGLHGRRVVTREAYVRVVYRPLGVVLGIMPWNFPYWQAARFIVPALAAGNVGLLKHAPNVPQSAEAFTELIAETAGLPLLQNLRLDNAATERLIADERVAGVSLTGSTQAGKAVGQAAGSALKPVVLELGGSDAYLVLADADLDLAVEKCVQGRLLNAGQSCISAKRLIVVDEVRDSFTEKLKLALAKYEFASSDPADDTSFQLAPLARADLRETLHYQVARSTKSGAECLLGGRIPSGPGFYYPATLLADVAPGQPAFDEELFGPVACIVPASGEAAAIALANRSQFGLGAAVFTRDVARGEEIAQYELEAGSCFVNDFVRSDPRYPFGGIKRSGYGRELALEGLRAFCNVKTVVTYTGATGRPG